ncbi:MAG: hypothetical protein JW735_06070 [Prolixibacteraceae bacterium]|nr:hypothetical protein [Prolixibacteraceae bacterium]
MKIIIVLFFMAAFFFHQIAYAQEFVPNYNETLVPEYNLPKLLQFSNGEPILSIDDWNKHRSALKLNFAQQMYGVVPKHSIEMQVIEIVEHQNALNGLALQKQICLQLKQNDHSIMLNVLMLLPKTNKKVPVFLGYNFYGNHTTSNDSSIFITNNWVMNNPDLGINSNKAGSVSRGKLAYRWPFDEVIQRGYGMVTLYYGDVDPDFDDGFKNGIHALFGNERDSASWGSIAAWAMGLSAVMDYLADDANVDANKVAVFGHSRLGKAALWAGALDQRFAMVISNSSGCGGAAISRRQYGETLARINTRFPHWFASNFKKYNNNENALPFDQHQLLALIAPRPLYVASAVDDRWADPKGEFLSAVAASEVYRLHGLNGLPVNEMPKVHCPSMGAIAYHIREGKHDILWYDWQQYLNFADMHFR